MQIELQATTLIRGNPRWDVNTYPAKEGAEAFSVVSTFEAGAGKHFCLYFHTPEQAADLAAAIYRAGQELAALSPPDEAVVPIGAEADEGPATAPMSLDEATRNYVQATIDNLGESAR